MLVTDLDLIRRQSIKNEDQNWRSRSFLKIQDDNEINLVVKPIYEFVQKNIDCLKCGNCCRIIRPTITKGDIAKLKKELKLNENEIIEKYTEKDEDNELIL